MSVDISPEAVAKMQADIGLPHPPTEFTYHCRLAVAGGGPRAYDWADKPHRLVFDLCREAEALAARVAELEADHAAALEAVKAQAWNDALEWAARQTAFMPETIPKSPRDAVHKALDQCDAAIRAGKVQP
jgi:hypothetical protein